MSFLEEQLCVNIYYGNYYFILVWKGLKPPKSKKLFFFLHTSKKFAIQNNPLMQLRLIFHKTFNKNILKVWKFKVIGLVVFQQLRKLYLKWKWGGGNCVLFLSSFLSVHMNFQNELNSHKNLFIVLSIYFLLLLYFVFNFSL